MNFNTDQGLWDNLFKSRQRFGGEPLKVVEGHIYEGQDVIGRFTTTADAEDKLRNAGFCKNNDGGWE